MEMSIFTACVFQGCPVRLVDCVTTFSLDNVHSFLLVFILSVYSVDFVITFLENFVTLDVLFCKSVVLKIFYLSQGWFRLCIVCFCPGYVGKESVVYVR